jgi:preprotein translocase subunit SecY
VYPYITASIILQILTPIIPTLKNLSQEGEGGRQAINRYTHYLTVPLAFLQGYGQLNLFAGAFSSHSGDAAISGIGIGGADTLNTVTILLAMTAGTMLLVWMGELVTEKGIGNGISLIIFAGIVSTLPQVVGQLWLLRDQMFQVGMLIFIAIAIVYLIVYFAEAQRKIPVQYGRSVFRGGQMYRQSGATHIPLRVNAAGMIPLIFSFSILILPSVVASYFNDGSGGFISNIANFFQNSFGPTSTIYWIAVFTLVVVFTFFYTLVVHNQQNLAENLQKNGGFVPGIRPGPPTKIYLMRVVLRITWGGALFLGFIAIMPFLAQLVTNLPNATTIIQSTSLLIMVGVALDTMRQLESQLLMRNYEGFVR